MAHDPWKTQTRQQFEAEQARAKRLRQPAPPNDPTLCPKCRNRLADIGTQLFCDRCHCGFSKPQ